MGGDRVSINRCLDDDSIAYEAAAVSCDLCVEREWTGTECPYGCGVRVLSVQAQESEDFNVRMGIQRAVLDRELAFQKANREKREAVGS